MMAQVPSALASPFASVGTSGRQTNDGRGTGLEQDSIVGGERHSRLANLYQCGP
jgi:hypothetical protein